MTLPKNVTLSRIIEISPYDFDSFEVEINQQSMIVVVDKSKHGTHFIKNEIIFKIVLIRCVCKHLFSGWRESIMSSITLMQPLPPLTNHIGRS
jgi:hypothetical protein